MLIIKDRRLLVMDAKTACTYLGNLKHLSFLEIWQQEQDTYDFLIDKIRTVVDVADREYISKELISQLIYLNKAQSDALIRDESGVREQYKVAAIV